MQNRTKALCIIVLFVAVFFVASPVSANGDESPQSITFCETLPDDVLFFPDNESHGSGYAESFTLVSDWTTSNTSITTDGDVATITENGAGSTGRAYASFASTDYFEYYYEFQISTMTATTTNLEFWDGSAYNTLHTFTAAGTYKGIISDSDATTMQRIGFLVGSNGGNIKPDYLRISPANESGWSHDGSTTAGTTHNANAEITSDGDILNCTKIAGSFGVLNLHVDTTTTKVMLDPNYYPFIEFYVSASSTGRWAVETYDQDGTYTPLKALDYETGIFRYNLKVNLGTDTLQYLFIKNYAGSLLIDWCKAYSIANFTISQSSTTTDDYLYVDSGTLYSHISSGTIEANHDPTLDLYHYRGWNVNTSSGTPEVDFYNGAWLGYATATEGEFAYGTTVEDFRLKFTDNANIISLEFNIMEASIFEELFLSTELWGYFGPLGLVIIGYLLIKKDKALGIFMFIVDCLVIAHYLTLVGATPAYWWHIFILLFGVIQCTIQLVDR